MKFFYLLLFVAVLTGCSKSNTSPSYTVQYQLSVNPSTSFFIRYTNSNNQTDTLSFTGTSWSKTITIAQNTGFKGAEFFILDKANVFGPPAPGAQGNAYIYLNGKKVYQLALDFTGGIGSYETYYPIAN